MWVNANFLRILDLLSEFDPLITSHIKKYGNKGKGIVALSSYVSQLILMDCVSKFSSGRASYLSDTICDEFIALIGVKVMNVILTELRDAKYFSLGVDSTPDVSHSDQLVFCIRYVKNDATVERFLQFIHINRHNSEYLTDTVIKFMSKDSIDISHCRGQSYDNTKQYGGQIYWFTTTNPGLERIGHISAVCFSFSEFSGISCSR